MANTRWCGINTSHCEKFLVCGLTLTLSKISRAASSLPNHVAIMKGVWLNLHREPGTRTTSIIIRSLCVCAFVCVSVYLSTALELAPPSSNARTASVCPLHHPYTQYRRSNPD